MKYKETFYEEISELSKGKFAIIDFKLKLNEQSYWKPNYRINKKLTFEDSKTLIKESLINSVLQKNEKMVNEYKSGKEKLFGFFVGQVMQESKGKANPQLVSQVLKNLLSK